MKFAQFNRTPRMDRVRHVIETSYGCQCFGLGIEHSGNETAAWLLRLPTLWK